MPRLELGNDPILCEFFALACSAIGIVFSLVAIADARRPLVLPLLGMALNGPILVLSLLIVLIEVIIFSPVAV
jgi:hypothetical protein